MQWKVENEGLNGIWIEIAQFAWRLDAQDFIDSMVSTRGYQAERFRIGEVTA